jgi:hypothetical protein
MPRKSKSVKGAKVQPALTEETPQPTLTEEQPQTISTEEQAASKKSASQGREANGKFAAGNPGGPGNPHARHCARMLEVFRSAVSVEAFTNIVCKLIEKAEAGDTSAAKIIVTYVVGKPLPAPHPDSIDRDEWDHYQKDAMNDKEMAVVMNALPTHVGNDIARVSLPIMTAARTRDLAKQLLKGCPGARGEKLGTRDEETEGSGPLPNGESSDAPVQPSTHHPAPATTNEPLPNGASSDATVQPSTRHPSPATNGKRATTHDSQSTTEYPSTRHTPPATSNFDPWDMDAAIAASTAQDEAKIEHEIKHELQGEEIAPIANGKLKNSKGSPRRSTTEQRSTTHDSRSTAKQPSTRHPSPATSRADDKKMYGKKIRKKANAL